MTIPSAVRAGEGEALVVLSSEAASYRALADGFALSIGSTHWLVVSGESFAADLKERLPKARLVLAVGPEAARLVLAERPTVPLLLAFAKPEQADARALVIPVLVPPAAQVATIKKLLPSIMDVPRQPRLGVLYDPALSSQLVAECESAAAAAGLTLVKAEVRQRSEVADAARDLLGRVQALWLISDATVVTSESFRTLVQLSLAHRVPMVGFSEAMAKAGAILSIQPNYLELGRRAGQVGKQMNGGAPPVMKPPEAMAFLNAKAATLLEIDLPDAARSKAAKVFE